MQEVLRKTREAYGPGVKVALFWDNCWIHQANIVKELAQLPEIDIELVFNLPYRPDCNGIELLWREAKRWYRGEADRLKAQAINWDQIGLVQHILEGIEDKIVARQARHGEEAIGLAEPIKPLETEQQIYLGGEAAQFKASDDIISESDEADEAGYNMDEEADKADEEAESNSVLKK